MNSEQNPNAAIVQIRHTASLLGAGKPVTIGYFGGSITEGYGASDPARTSWRARTTHYLRERFPGSPVTEIHAAIGGTGSDLGAFRCDEDLLSHNLDLVFVEFAVNDYETDENRVLRAMEGIVRKIRCASLQTDIVFVYTAIKAMEETYARDETPASVLAHARVAAHYRIPALNIGKALCEAVSGRFNGNWRALTIDDVHPNDDGYALYAQQVIDFLDASLANSRYPQGITPTDRAALPGLLTPNSFVHGCLFDAWRLIETHRWTRESETLAGRYPHRLVADDPQAGILRLPFQGDAIGLYWLVAPDSGDIEWSIDGNVWRRHSSWDRFALHFTRANYVLLAENLEQGTHELRLRVSPNHAKDSTGAAVRIGAILISGVALESL